MAEEENKEAEDRAPEEGERDQAGTPLKSKKKLILIISPILAVVVILSLLFFMGFFDSLFKDTVKERETGASQESSATKDAPQGAAPASDTGEPASIFFDVPEMLVNLNTGTKKQAYLKVQVSLDLPDAETSAKVEKILPRIIDSFQVYLRELKLEEIQGSTGMYRLKEELVERINRIISPSKINDVLFKEMLIQ